MRRSSSRDLHLTRDLELYSYYLVRIRHRPTAERSVPVLGGVLERLDTGAKRAFADGEELLVLLRAWLPPAASIPAVAVP